MIKIEKGDINFRDLYKIDCQGTNSTIYTDGTTCFKILDKTHPDEKKGIYEKFSDLSGEKIDGVIMPEDFIFDRGEFIGYTMPYFANSMPLSDRFFTRQVDLKKLSEALTKTSIIMRKLHDKGVMCQDFSFENVLINNKGEVVYCDLDSCYFNGHESLYISYLLKRFMIDYRGDLVVRGENTDRISMMISYYYLMFALELQKVSQRKFLRMSEDVETVYNSVDVANMFIDRSEVIGDVPYLDELISANDTGILDRWKHKQKAFSKRYLKQR